MSGKNKKNIPMWAKLGHGKPVTRRELLACGAIAFSASIFLPRWWRTGMGEKALAGGLNCPVPAPGLIPFISINLAGGAALGGNYIPLDAGGQLLPNYNFLGLGSTAALPIEREFGNVGFAGAVGGRLISQILQGIRTAAPNAIQKTAFVATCTRTRDDYPHNSLSPAGMLAHLGLTGSLLPAIGNANTSTGINQDAAVMAAYPPLVANSLSVLTSALTYTTSLQALNPTQQQALAKLVSGLSQTQARRLASATNGDQMQTVLSCAGIKNQSLIGGAPAIVDPRLDPTLGSALSALWGVTADTAANDINLVAAGLAYNALNGQAGLAGINLGGYDYHDQTRTTGDAADLTAGLMIGRVLETANFMNKPVFIHVTTDGAVGSANSMSSTAVWAGDRGTGGVNYMLHYNPAGRPATSGSQIGCFTAGQVNDETTLTGNAPEVAAGGVVANYLKVCGQFSLFNSLGVRGVDATNVDQLLRFV